MLNSFDVHDKGMAALRVGFQMDKMADSLCFEVAAFKHKMDEQLEKMKALVESSEKRLALLTGSERFLSVSCSHMSQFPKTVGCGQCLTENQEPMAVNNGYLTLESLESSFQDEEFANMARHGWNWRCIKAEVEESCPWLPQLLQAALNTGNEISKQATEMEIAANLV